MTAEALMHNSVNQAGDLSISVIFVVSSQSDSCGLIAPAMLVIYSLDTMAT
uniref:Uncharacterized protein n=1 Tax=Anguilla anguilla TaxID=7936 RepID=A0A0E9SVE7_ANGAN